MADYDSDSSDGECAETNVLLGYASKDAEEDTISHLGGRPEWLDADKPPSAALARCKICKDLMVLLLQLNGELPGRFPNHDRRIYVFACKRASCSRREGSIRALRGVRVWADDEAAEKDKVTEKEEEAKKQEEKPREPEQPKPRLGDALFGGGPSAAAAGSANPFSSNANPFSSSTGGAASSPFGASPFASQPPAAAAPAPTTTKDKDLPKTFAATLSLHSPITDAVRPPAPEPWPAPAQQPTPYPTLYLADADYETLDPEPADLPLPANARIEDADAPETTSAADREAFESAMDTTFQKFADRLAQNPEQAIRYEFGGAPLLCSKTDAVGRMVGRAAMPRCAACGGRRVFEVQLTPHAITELEAETMNLEGMEWGTVIVGVCERDCVPGYLAEEEPAYLEEWAGVQWEDEGARK
ncbi:PDCD2 domain protein [Cordyceps militaris CM01]|uniref:PDCD2 domain protein n=2 Tax=Cordyceps militaris TaxID=73501 RepID=G3J463_CORMM|nr:PDCD2 domain protein [Cordyceps militaris CM01]ATY63787.1 PDCD2 domain [Cordyceps militaris]EGX96634.1 PDCD2 domain protein [Cordyceps militaris CM01]